MLQYHTHIFIYIYIYIYIERERRCYIIASRSTLYHSIMCCGAVVYIVAGRDTQYLLFDSEEYFLSGWNALRGPPASEPIILPTEL